MHKIETAEAYSMGKRCAAVTLYRQRTFLIMQCNLPFNWKIKFGKAQFAVETWIDEELINHIRHAHTHKDKNIKMMQACNF